MIEGKYEKNVIIPGKKVNQRKTTEREIDSGSVYVASVKERERENRRERGRKREIDNGREREREREWERERERMGERERI